MNRKQKREKFIKDKRLLDGKRSLNKAKKKKLGKSRGAKKTTSDSTLRPWCRFKITDRPAGYLKQPKGPHPGAMLTVRQIVPLGSFTTKAGTAVSGSAVVSGAADTFFALAFGLQDMSDTSSYSSIFDQYRFEKIKLHFMSMNNVVVSTPALTPLVPFMYLVADFDDAAVLGSIQAAREFGTCHVIRLEDCVTLEWKPTYNLDSEGQVGAAMRLSGDWLDMAEPDVPHFGCKGAISNHAGASATVAIWQVEAEYVVSFNNSR